MEYELKRVRSRRTMRLTLRRGGSLHVVAPRGVSIAAVEAFILEHQEWIDGERAKYGAHPIAFTRARYLSHRDAARAIIKSRVGFINDRYGFTVGRIAIRDQHTVWGSCSTGGNLNFNYRLFFLPLALQEYVIVHELCHLREHNHSPRFWALVAEVLPHHKQLDRELKRYGYML